MNEEKYVTTTTLTQQSTKTQANQGMVGTTHKLQKCGWWTMTTTAQQQQ